MDSNHLEVIGEDRQLHYSYDGIRTLCGKPILYKKFSAEYWLNVLGGHSCELCKKIEQEHSNLESKNYIDEDWDIK